MDEQIQLTMDRDVAGIVMRACEFYSRVLCGQYDQIPNEVMDSRLAKILKEEGKEKMHEKFDEVIRQRDDAADVFKNARKIQFPELDLFAHYGFGYSELTDRAFDVYQVLRYAIAWHDHPEGGYTVNFDKPMSKYELPKAEFIK